MELDIWSSPLGLADVASIYSTAAGVLLGTLLIAAGILKLRWPNDFEQLLIALLPPFVKAIGIRRLSRAACVTEIALGLGLVAPDPIGTLASVATTGAMLTFVGIAIFAARNKMPCGCFGKARIGELSAQSAGAINISRTIVLALVSATTTSLRFSGMAGPRLSLATTMWFLVVLSASTALATMVISHAWRKGTGQKRVDSIASADGHTVLHLEQPSEQPKEVSIATTAGLRTRRSFLKSLGSAAALAIAGVIGLPFSRKDAWAYYFHAQADVSAWEPNQWGVYWLDYDAGLPDGLPITIDFGDGTGGTWYASGRNVTIYKYYTTEGDFWWTARQPSYGLQDWSRAIIFAGPRATCEGLLKACNSCCAWVLSCIICCSGCFFRCGSGNPCARGNCTGCWDSSG